MGICGGQTGSLSVLIHFPLTDGIHEHDSEAFAGKSECRHLISIAELSVVAVSADDQRPGTAFCSRQAQKPGGTPAFRGTAEKQLVNQHFVGFKTPCYAALRRRTRGERKIFIQLLAYSFYVSLRIRAALERIEQCIPLCKKRALIAS